MAHPNIIFFKENSNLVSFKVIHLHNIKNYVAQSDPCSDVQHQGGFCVFQ